MLICACANQRPVTVAEPAPAQDDYYAPQQAIAFEDRVYDSDVRTVQVWRNGVEGDVPIMELGSADQLRFEFDVLGGDEPSLSFAVVYCDAQWRPSDLVPLNYLDGAPSDFVPAPRRSSATRVGYSHYAVPFPNALMRPKVSGNFLLKVYRGSDPDDLLLTRRFMITEQLVRIDARVVATRNVEDRDYLQQVDLTINHPGLHIPDPFGDLGVTVLQNMRWDDARTGLLPRYTRAFELIYDFPSQALFNGGNEWRPLNAKSVRYARIGIQRIEGDSTPIELVLVPDLKRNISVHIDQPDLNGRHLVRTDDGYDPTTDADYVMVDWTLPLAAPLGGGQLFVYGAYSGYQLTKEFRCAWDDSTHCYRARAMMKQGFADYCYAFLPDGSTVPDLTLVEGNHYDTENDYLVLVYLKDHVARADRLIASRVVNSRR